MLLDRTRRHGKSLSCTLLQREMQRQNNEVLTCRRAANPEFVPFCLERKLGKLIVNDEKQHERRPSNAELLEKINFRNFHKIYMLVSKHENERYSQLTRSNRQVKQGPSSGTSSTRSGRCTASPRSRPGPLCGGPRWTSASG